MHKLINYLVLGLFVTVIVLCLLLSYRSLNMQSCAILVVYNLFFMSFLFQLNGRLTIKMAILATGNIIGLFWNYLFQTISNTGYLFFGSAFNGFYAIIYPILTLMWVVPFWSLSLSFLPKLPSNPKHPT